MKTLAFEIEVVTPLYLSGASQEISELRPNTIKTLMRWWYRAARGEVSNIKQESKEFELFGSTETAGKFIPRIKFSNSNKIPNSPLKFNELRDFNGIKYLAFPFRQSNRSKIEPFYTFQFSLKFLPNVSIEDENAVLASLWLLMFLGAVGSRSRRGFGSLRVNKPFFHESSGLEFFFNGDAGDFLSFFKKNLTLALEAIGFSRSLKESKDVSFTTLSSKNSRIFLYLKNKKHTFNWGQDALNDIGEFLQYFRKHTNLRNKDDYLSVREFLDYDTPPPQYKRAAFGLPIIIQYRSLFEKYFTEIATEAFDKIGKTVSEDFLINLANGRKNIAVEKLRLKGLTRKGVPERIWDKAKRKSSATLGHGSLHKSNSEKTDRRSSPLFIKVIKLKENSYIITLLFLPSKFLPDEERLKVVSNDGREEFFQSMVDFSAINDFLNSNQVKNNLIEISF